MSAAQIEYIGSNDAMLGWAAANAARRAELTEDDQERIRQFCLEGVERDKAGTVHWRAVHAMGKHPSEKNAGILMDILRQDNYHWAQYGAARALVEMAAFGSRSLRESILSVLEDFVTVPRRGSVVALRQILKEILEVAIIDDAPPQWGTLLKPIVDKILSHGAVAGEIDKVRPRVALFYSKFGLGSLPGAT